jgi:uncharacterized protein YbjT (DUF2867 family)
MKILLTGATGYIGKRLLLQLLEKGHHVVCTVRDPKRFHLDPKQYNPEQITVLTCDFLEADSLQKIPNDIQVAYYLVHSMGASVGNFSDKEKTSALNFKARMEATQVQQVIYLTGIVNQTELSEHLSSRQAVETYLTSEHYALTVLRAGIVLGSGSASFEIIRDLCEKLPIMVAPIWLKTQCQPIAVRNVIEFLCHVMLDPYTYHQHFDIAAPECLSYQEMLLQFAQVRGLKRYIFTLPVMTPKLSSYWLYFITSTSYPLAQNLVDSMKIDVIAQPNGLAQRYNIQLLSYQEAVALAFDKIKQNNVLSSWHDTFSHRFHKKNVWKYLEIPQRACLIDHQQYQIQNETATLDKVFAIGGNNGWYYGDFLWQIRGFIDKLFGGVGLKRGRRDSQNLEPGDSLDFWRVLYANRQEKKLILLAEMKLPGEAWLSFSIKDGQLHQTATFRPRGLRGRLYWYAMLPFHYFIFGGMIKRLALANP